MIQKRIEPVDLDEHEHLYHQGRQAFEKNDWKTALDFFGRSLRLMSHSKTMEMMALCYQNLGDRKLALSMAQDAYRANPKSNKTGVVLASLLMRNGKKAEARAILTEILRHSPTYGPAKRLLSES